MLRDFPFGELKQLFHLYLAWMHKRKSKERMAKARKRMDLAIASTTKPSAFVLAFDGLLMIREDRLALARARFEESLKLASEGESADDDYVARYCTLWLTCFEVEAGWDEIADKAYLVDAAWTNASRMLQIYLPRSPLEGLKEIYGYRMSKTSKSQEQIFTLTNADSAVTFEF